MLNQSSKKLQYQTVAFGYSGTGQAQQLSYYEPYIKKIKPSIVVMVIAHNDFSNNSPLMDTIRYGYGLECQPFTTIEKQADGYVVKKTCAEFNEHFIDEKVNQDMLSQIIKHLHEQSALYRYLSPIITSYFPSFDFLIPRRGDTNTLVIKRLKYLENIPYKDMASHENNLTYRQLDSRS